MEDRQRLTLQQLEELEDTLVEAIWYQAIGTFRTRHIISEVLNNFFQPEEDQA